MRIDYSDPKKSYSTPQQPQNRPRSQSSGGMWLIVLLTAVISLGIGFGSGWMLSQRAAKKGFKAAMEQISLENSPAQTKPAVSTQHPAPPQTAQAVAPPTSAQTPPPAATTTPGETPLSFYKTLPSGQKSNVMGSGINSKEDKTAKQPLQAALPANAVRQQASGTADEPTIPAQPPAAKQQPRPDASGFTVQVASYSLKSEAETMRGTLAAKGYNVNIVESHLGDKGTWYRVRVGKRLEAEAAKDLAKKLGKSAMAIPDRDKE